MPTKNRIGEFQFEISQSVTSSAGEVFAKFDTVEASFLTQGSGHNAAFSKQYIDLYWASDSRTNPTWQKFPAGEPDETWDYEYPKRFYYSSILYC